jgi:hypothetical protein
MKGGFIIFSLALLLFSCKKEDTFKRDDLKRVNGLKIRCLHFEDSRCPEDVTCITAGTAFATLWVDKGSDGRYVFVELGESAEALGYEIDFESLTPYPSSSNSNEELEAEFKVNKL